MTGRRYKLLIAIAVVAVLGLAFSRVKEKEPLCPKCNIILIDIDVLRADGLECFGNRKVTAPNLCRFAKNATRFQRNISQSYWTMPSMFSTVTSLYVTAHNVRYALADRLSPAILTMAELLKSREYQTSFMSSMLPTEAWFLNEDNGGLRGYDHIEYERSIETWLPTIKELERSGKPFFLHVYTQDPHMPYLLPDGVSPKENIPKPTGLPITQNDFDEALENYLAAYYRDVFREGAIREKPELFQDPTSSKRQLREYYQTLSRAYDLERLKVTYTAIENTYMQFVDGNKPDDRAYLRMLYDMKVTHMDAKLKPVLEYLTESPRNDDTIVVIMSDHGEAFGERGSFLHDDSQYNETIRTPLVMRIPGLGGRDVTTVTQNIDIAPTIMDAIGARVPRQFQGISLIPLMKGLTSMERVAVSEADTKVSIQDSRFKLIADKSGLTSSFEFYNLAEDPIETNNLVSTHEPLAKEYYTKLRSLLDRSDRQFQHLLPININSGKRRKILKEGYF